MIRLSLATTAMLAILSGDFANGQQRGSAAMTTKPAIAGAEGSPSSPRLKIKPHRRKGVMNELVERPSSNLNYGDADSAGFFQMRQGILHRGGSAGIVSPRIAVPSVRAR